MIYNFKLAQQSYFIGSSLSKQEIDTLIVMLSLYNDKAYSLFIRPLTIQVCVDGKYVDMSADELIERLMDLSNHKS